MCVCVSEGVLKRLEEEDLDEGVRRRLKDSSETPGALWHIYLNRDMDKVRDFLHKVSTHIEILSNRSKCSPVLTNPLLLPSTTSSAL